MFGVTFGVFTVIFFFKGICNVKFTKWPRWQQPKPADSYGHAATGQSRSTSKGRKLIAKFFFSFLETIKLYILLYNSMEERKYTGPYLDFFKSNDSSYVHVCYYHSSTYEHRISSVTRTLWEGTAENRPFAAAGAERADVLWKWTAERAPVITSWCNHSKFHAVHELSQEFTCPTWKTPLLSTKQRAKRYISHTTLDFCLFFFFLNNLVTMHLWYKSIFKLYY